MTDQPARTIPGTFSFELALPGAREDVWRAISDAGVLRRWFPIEARIKPGVGGSVFLSWGPSCEGEAPITLWEEGRALGWQEQHDGGATIVSAVFEIVSENADGTTTLRVTQSGFGQGAAWGDYYDSIASGWKFELRSLRHYLARHKGRERAARGASVRPGRPMGRPEAWAALRGLVTGGTLAGHAEGERYAFAGPDGRAYSGRVVRSVPEHVFAATVEGLDDALLRIELEPAAGGTECRATFWLSWWGGDGREVEGIIGAWEARARALLGA